MQPHRSLLLGLIVLVLAALGLWFLSQGGEPPIAPPAPEAAKHATAAPDAAPVEDGNRVATGELPPKVADEAERTAVAPGRGVDERLPGFTGRVVGPNGQPIAGAQVGVAAGLGFADGSGAFDPQSFDLGSLDAFDPGAMLRSVREQLADRVVAETDPDGRFRVVAKGTSRAVGLRVLARGHGILERRFERPRDQDLDVGTLTLQAAAIVAGRVLTPAGAPVVGARVGRMLDVEQRLMGGIEFEVPAELGEIDLLRGGGTVLTDEAGQFELAHVPPGELVLRAQHPDHVTAKSQPLAIEVGRELRSVLLTMEVGGVITGVVQGLPADTSGLQVLAARKPKAAAADAAGANGLGNLMGNLGVDLDAVLGEAGFGLGERSATIGADGSFAVRGLARDTWRVWVARTGSGLAGGSTCSERKEASPGDRVELRFEPGVTVTFTVADGKTGAPVERLLVRDRLRGGRNAGMSDLIGMAAGGMQPRRTAHYPNGAVTVANLRPKAEQKLSLTIEAVGYASLERGDLELPATGNLDLGKLVLEPVPVLEILVVAADGGRPVSGATVRLVRSNDGAAPEQRRMVRELRRFAPGGLNGIPGVVAEPGGRTGSDGRLLINRPTQAATIEVDARGFAPFASASIPFSAEGPAAFTASLRVGGGVAATVVDLADKPVAGATVEHRSPDGGVDDRKADAQGLARFEHLTPGVHQFRLGKDGGGLGRALGQFGRRGGANGTAAPADGGPPWQSVEVADQATAAVRLTKQATATLRGSVRENGVALAGARVSFREGAATAERDPQARAFGELAERFAPGAARGGSQNRSPRTDDQGGYELRELPEGEHHLVITHASRQAPTTVKVVLQNGDNLVDVDLDVTLLRGAVKDAAGKPIAGAQIRVRRPRAADDEAGELGEMIDSVAAGMGRRGGGSGAIETDAAGNFEVRGLDADVQLEVAASAKGFAPAAARVTAARGAVTMAPDLVLGASGTVRVTVAGNQPFGAVVARWVGPGEGVSPVRGVLRRGTGTLEGLRPGTWEISVESMEALGGRLRGRLGRGQGEPQQPAQPAAKQTVEVLAGQTAEVNL